MSHWRASLLSLLAVLAAAWFAMAGPVDRPAAAGSHLRAATALAFVQTAVEARRAGAEHRAVPSPANPVDDPDDDPDAIRAGARAGGGLWPGAAGPAARALSLVAPAPPALRATGPPQG